MNSLRITKFLNLTLRRIIFQVLVVVINLSIFLSCLTNSEKSDTESNKETKKRDLENIITEKKLVALVENSTISYFIYRGQPMGLEYEILKRFANEIGVQLEIRIIQNLDDLIPNLNNLEGDLIACNYTVTKDRLGLINFTLPHMRTSQVLIQRKPENWENRKKSDWTKDLLSNTEDLLRKKIHVWGNSSYQKRLAHIQDEMGDTIYIENIEGNVTSEELIEWVSEGLIDYTITDQNVAQINESFYDNIDVSLQISFPQKIAFGIRKESPALTLRFNAWLEDFMKTSTYSYILHKYLNMKSYSQKAQNEYSSLGGGKISQFDDDIKLVTSEYNWDWRLFSAVVYQESKFQENLESWAGAYGLMQFMPSVGPTYGVYPDSPPIVQFRGGMKKIIRNIKDWEEIPDSIQQIKFALATYNAGLGHILDAQRLAEKYGDDPLVWDENVEKYMLLLSKPKYYQDEVCRNGYMRGVETYKYVRSVFARYQTYQGVFN